MGARGGHTPRPPFYINPRCHRLQTTPSSCSLTALANLREMSKQTAALRAATPQYHEGPPAPGRLPPPRAGATTRRGSGPGSGRAWPGGERCSLVPVRPGDGGADDPARVPRERHGGAGRHGLLLVRVSGPHLRRRRPRQPHRRGLPPARARGRVLRRLRLRAPRRRPRVAVAPRRERLLRPHRRPGQARGGVAPVPARHRRRRARCPTPRASAPRRAWGARRASRPTRRAAPCAAPR